MQIEFTREQFLELMKIVFLGEFVINGQLLPDGWKDEPMKLKEYIVQKAVDAKILDHLEYYEWSKCHDYSHKKSEEFFDLVKEYCDQDFHEELIEIVSHKMLHKKHGEWAINVMSAGKYDQLFGAMTETVQDDFIENGYENLTLVTK